MLDVAIRWTGYAAAGLLWVWLKGSTRKISPPPMKERGLLLAGAAIGGALGAAAMYALDRYGNWQPWLDPAFARTSHSMIGGMIGSWIGLEWVKTKLRLAYPNGDVFVFPILLAIGFSRLSGIFSATPDHLAKYELAFVGLLACILLFRISRHRQRGCMFSQFAFAYLAFAFVLDFFRARYVLGSAPISAAQLAAVAGLINAMLHWNDECCTTTTPAKQQDSDSQPRFAEMTTSLCPLCLQKVEAKILVEDSAVMMRKFCPEHGLHRVLISDDPSYWQRSRELYKPPTPPLRRNTQMKRGCPYDCGICPDHEQHSCLAVVEITDQCNLRCPTCYAACSSGGHHRSLDHIRAMLDSVVANEGKVNVVQISGGEPTLHPDLFAVLDEVKKRPIRHLMLNTNGVQIADNPDFAKRLADYMPGFEVYLQFDSLQPETLQRLRGRDLSGVRRRAIDHMEKAEVSTTLVCTLKKGVNDQQIGEIIDFALSRKCIRGVTFQPIQAAGRLDGFDPEQRLTLSEVRRAILSQHKLFTPGDIVPVPCHADVLAMGYALKVAGRYRPLSSFINPATLTAAGGNTICYEQDPGVRLHLAELFSAAASPTSAAMTMEELCCGPKLPGGLSYRDIFRVIIMQFMDAWTMDLRSLKRSCVHIVHPDGRLMPFETYNLLHRHGQK